MPVPRRFSSAFWIIAPLLALGFLVWLTNARLVRFDKVTNLVETQLEVDPTSPTGYAGGLRRLIVPEHNYDSYQWLLQTQHMLAEHEWRIRHVSYDNAPVGRTLLTPSPYRWWLGLVSGIDRWLSGQPAGLAVERSARIAEPLLEALLLVSAVLFVAGRIGIAPAVLLSLATVTLYPLGGGFLPGQPDDEGLALFCVLWSALFLLAGIPSPGSEKDGAILNVTQNTGTRTSRWFVASGIAGGLGLWIDVKLAIPVLVGTLLGGLLTAWAGKRATQAVPNFPSHFCLAWRYWALTGAATTLVAYLVEYSPDYLGSFQLRNVHPVYGLSWIGAGELLALVTPLRQEHTKGWNWRKFALGFAALVLVAASPVALIWTKSGNLFADDPNVTRLTSLSGSANAQNLGAWIVHVGFNRIVLATLLPCLLILPAGWLFLRKKTTGRSRALLGLGIGPALVTLGFALFYLHDWNLFDATLLVLLVALTSAATQLEAAPLIRWTGALGLLLVFLPGAIVLFDKARSERDEVAGEADLVALIERDLSHWLAHQAESPGTVVLAPPTLTTSLIYHGGLSGIATSFWQNREGTLAAMRIVASSSPDEAQAVARARNVSYIVVPSWDNFLDEYARLGAAQEQHTLIASLHHWLPPRWLRPVPYHLPTITNFEGLSVAIFQVVEVQDNATALSHLAEYFVEMDMSDQAAGVADALAHSFPGDLGAAIARALVARAANDAAAFGKALDDIQISLGRGEAENLTWDRHVSLAIALVEGRRFDAAREQVRYCLAEMDEARLRTLTTLSLHRLQDMSRGFGLEFRDARLRALAQQLSPTVQPRQP